MSDLLESAVSLLAANTQQGSYQGRLFRFSVPSVRSYPFQWNWDSCFHAVVLAKEDLERAKDELRGLFAHQCPDGSIPHVIFWNQQKVSRLSWHYLESAGRWRYFDPRFKPSTSGQMQPPVVAQAVERIEQVGGDFAREALPALERHYRHLASARTRPGRHLISIISQFESGLDYSPAYDEATGVNPLRPISIFARPRLVQIKNMHAGYDLAKIFQRDDTIEDVLVNSIYIDGLRALARLARANGQDGLAVWAENEAVCARDELLELWDPNRRFFYNRNGNGRPATAVRTIHGLMPLLLSDLPREIVDSLLEQLLDPRRFGAPYPVPSVALDEPTFLPDSHLYGFRFIWRGPSSLNTNWFIVNGLRAHGENAVADMIAGRSREMIEQGGFNEFFNPCTGTPTGAARFGWAALAADLG